MKRKSQLFLFLLLLVALLIAGVSGIVMLFIFSNPRVSVRVDTIRTLIVFSKSPEAVAEQWMNACQDGNAEEIFNLLSEASKNRFQNRVVLSDPGRETGEILMQIASGMKDSLAGAVFEFEKQKSEPGNNSRITILVRILHQNGVCREFPLTLVRKPSGQWKCDVRI